MRYDEQLRKLGDIRCLFGARTCSEQTETDRNRVEVVGPEASVHALKANKTGTDGNGRKACEPVPS
jgi:hypothetical protein